MMSIRYRFAGLVSAGFAGLWLLFSFGAHAETPCSGQVAVCQSAPDGSFPLIRSGMPTPILVDGNDWPGVKRAAHDLQTDLASIGGKTGTLISELPARTALPAVVIVGTLGRSSFIDRLVAEGALDTSVIEGEWEAYLQAVVKDPMPGISEALVIVGADKRGTIYGIYDLSERAGVSPWVWWADVPVPHQADVGVLPGAVSDQPKVKYRGIFLNDENPALYGWVNETFGGFNHDFYAKVFELILRQKGNYLWPAMWGKAFWDDDPLNGATADEYGVVIGTSHHEPLMRAHVEWERYGEGPWDYSKNDDRLREFWRGGMERARGVETVVTVGMRGDGDEAMTEGTAIGLLERIVRDQRRIIEETTGHPAAEQPQIWALYKEVQDYFDQGMQVPGDVTLLFADDNWGNIRRLPVPGNSRPGGYGVYYHFDYVGGPRNYKWLNTTQIERTWEEMNLAWEYGADRMWIVNVGDLKPMELPINFFLDYAWDPEDWPLERLPSYSTAWAEQQFGPDHAEEIADLLDRYTKYNSRRKPELLDASTYSLASYREFERVVSDYNALAERADVLLENLPASQKDAFLQLVWFPIQACANLNELYYTVALNRLYAEQGRSDTNLVANRAEDLFARDTELTRIYHEDIAGGKWDHMMSQTHIGYTYWQQPEEQVMPEIVRMELSGQARLGLAIEGQRAVWPNTQEPAILPVSDSLNRQPRFFELFNRSKGDVAFRIRSNRDWLRVSEATARFAGTKRIDVIVDWEDVPFGQSIGTLKVRTGWWNTITVHVPVFKPQPGQITKGYFASDDALSIPASGFSRAVNGRNVAWKTIPNLGLSGDAIGVFPRVHSRFEMSADAPRLEYDVNTQAAGVYTIGVVMSPTLDFQGTGGGMFAISVDDQDPVVLNATGGLEPDSDAWNEAVSHNRIVRKAHFQLKRGGEHVVKIWLIDPGLVFQDILMSRGDLPETYLAPPYSYRVDENARSGRGQEEREIQ